MLSSSPLSWVAHRMPGVLYIFQRDGEGNPQISYISDGCRQMLGLSPKELMENFRVFRKCVLVDDRPRFDHSLVEVARTESTWQLDFRILVQGEIRWIRGHSQPEQGEDGRIRWAGLLTDITSHRQMETQLALAARLSTIGTLAAGVAHEMNNPLSYLTANLAFALESIPSHLQECEEIRSALQDASDGARRLQELVADLKAFSRSNDPRQGPIRLMDAAALAQRITSSQVRSRCELILNVPEQLLLYGSLSLYAQLFVGLIVYVVQRFERQQPGNIIQLSAAQQDNDAEIRVFDTSPPLSAQEQIQLFEPFNSEDPRNTGLGLLLCQSICTQFNGNIVYQFRENHNSFLIRLPLYRVPTH